jgi:integrase
MEKIGPKSLAQEMYQQRKIAVKTQGWCLTAAREALRRAHPTLFHDLTRRYLTWSQEHRPRSYTFRVPALKHLVDAFGGQAITTITRAQVEASLTARSREAQRPAMVNRERSVLSHCFTKATDWGLLHENPVRSTERLTEDHEHPRPLTRVEEARLVAVLPAHYMPVVTLALHTGLRLGELRAQQWRDVDLAAGLLTVTRPKSGKSETLPLNRVAFSVLAALEQDGPLLFPRLPKKLSDLFIRYARKAGLLDVTFHCLRDTYISRLAPHCNTPSLMTLARHRDYRTTQRYVRIDGAHLRQTVEQLVSDPLAGAGIVTQTVTSPSAMV